MCFLEKTVSGFPENLLCIAHNNISYISRPLPCGTSLHPVSNVRIAHLLEQKHSFLRSFLSKNDPRLYRISQIGWPRLLDVLSVALERSSAERISYDAIIFLDVGRDYTNQVSKQAASRTAAPRAMNSFSVSSERRKVSQHGKALVAKPLD